MQETGRYRPDIAGGFLPSREDLQNGVETEAERVTIWYRGTTVYSKLKKVQLLFYYTVKKPFRYCRAQPGCHLPNSPFAGIMTSYINYSCPGRVW
jgi:hypothetical protein